MYSSSIEAFKIEYNELVEFFQENGQPSFQIAINNSYRKTLILSVASFFESEIMGIILNYARFCSNNDIKLISFIDTKALARQYHALFDWDSRNCNKFFKWFGESAKESAKEQIKQKQLEQSMQDFLNIGSERNRLVHQNLIEIVLNDTFEEIYSKYRSACLFVEFIRNFLIENTESS
jgi:hypothetical protein